MFVSNLSFILPLRAPSSRRAGKKKSEKSRAQLKSCKNQREKAAQRKSCVSRAKLCNPKFYERDIFCV